MFSVDPRTDEYSWQSPYVYHRNNPINYIDFLGGGDGDDWLYNEEDDEYVWDSNTNDPSQTPENYEYVGKSVSDVMDHYEENNPVVSLVSDPTIGDPLNRPWDGEIIEYIPSAMDNWASSDNIIAATGYSILNGIDTTGQFFIGRGVESGMVNLDGTPTTTKEGVLGFSSTALIFMGGASSPARTSEAVSAYYEPVMTVADDATVVYTRATNQVVRAPAGGATHNNVFYKGGQYMPRPRLIFSRGSIEPYQLMTSNPYVNPMIYTEGISAAQKGGVVITLSTLELLKTIRRINEE